MIKVYLGDRRVNLVAEKGAIVDTRTGKTYMDIVVSDDCVQYYHDDIDDEQKAVVAADKAKAQAAMDSARAEAIDAILESLATSGISMLSTHDDSSVAEKAAAFVAAKMRYDSIGKVVNPDEGEYINPIRYADGMVVENGKWYTDGEDIWEAVKDGVPASFSDKDYFDVVE